MVVCVCLLRLSEQQNHTIFSVTNEPLITGLLVYIAEWSKKVSCCIAGWQI